MLNTLDLLQLAPEAIKIKYKVFNAWGKIKSISYSGCINENGELVYQGLKKHLLIPTILKRDMRFYKETLSYGDYLEIYINGEFLKKVAI